MAHRQSTVGIMLSEFAALMLVAGIVVAHWSFNRIRNREEFQALRDSGWNLSLFGPVMLGALARTSFDPLRRAHSKLARIALAHFAVTAVWFLLTPYLVAAFALMFGVA